MTEVKSIRETDGATMKKKGYLQKGNGSLQDRSGRTSWKIDDITGEVCVGGVDKVLSHVSAKGDNNEKFHICVTVRIKEDSSWSFLHIGSSSLEPHESAMHTSQKLQCCSAIGFSGTFSVEMDEKADYDSNDFLQSSRRTTLKLRPTAKWEVRRKKLRPVAKWLTGEVWALDREKGARPLVLATYRTGGLARPPRGPSHLGRPTPGLRPPASWSSEWYWPASVRPAELGPPDAWAVMASATGRVLPPASSDPQALQAARFPEQTHHQRASWPPKPHSSSLEHFEGLKRTISHLLPSAARVASEQTLRQYPVITIVSRRNGSPSARRPPERTINAVHRHECNPGAAIGGSIVAP
ncbi:hypothetical protein KSP40_PGU022564 [Platanthera guangdongensis]|uniref:Uncharacterized protein n=1 Tax=Platanthera guangdongensis TaxID=2320717 RepID=A0ABR2MUM4_9ASPA